jgi:hypothetical protein
MDMIDMRMALLLSVFIFCLFAIPLSSAQQVTEVAVRGECGEFMISIMASGLYNQGIEGNGCWDAKLDLPGQIFNPSAGQSGDWRSSFYYIDDALCPPEDKVVITIRPNSISPTIEGTAKLRQGNTIIERQFTISQDCPQPLGWEWVILTALIIVLFFGYLLAWWMRRK